MDTRSLRLVADLSERIEHCSFDPTGWQGVIDDLARAAPGAKIVLQSVDIASALAIPALFSGWSADEMALYAEHYNETNVFMPPFREKPIMVPQTARDLVPTRDLQRSEFFNDFLMPSDGVVDGIGLKLIAGDDRFAALTVNYSSHDARVLEPWFRSVLTTLAPSLRRALDCNKVAALNAAKEKARSLVHGLADAAMVCTGDGFILAANDKALSLARSLSHRADPDHVGHLVGMEALLDSLLQLKSGRAGERLAKRVASPWFNLPDLILALSGQPHRISLLPLSQPESARAGMGGIVDEAASILVILRQDAVQPLEAFFRRYGLSAAESRLTRALTEGHSLAHAASMIGIAIETARSQLKSIFSKTGTHRQAELVALAHRATSPFSMDTATGSRRQRG